MEYETTDRYHYDVAPNNIVDAIISEVSWNLFVHKYKVSHPNWEKEIPVKPNKGLFNKATVPAFVYNDIMKNKVPYGIVNVLNSYLVSEFSDFK